jgi:hypothetical protein
MRHSVCAGLSDVSSQLFRSYGVYLVKKGSVLSFFAIQLAFVITAWPLVRIVRQGRKQFSQRPLGYTFVTFAFISVGVGAHVAVAVGVRPA